MPLDTLSIIAETVISLLGDSVKEHLTPKKSADIAKTKVIYLYKVLGKINEETDSYIKNFELYLSALSSNESKEITGSLKEQLKPSVINIWELIGKLQKALESLNPQLEIYNQNLVDDISAFYAEREMMIYTLQAEIYYKNSFSTFKTADAKKLPNKKPRVNKRKILETTDVGELRIILSKIKQNQKSINKITKKFREFIASEFNFKESF